MLVAVEMKEGSLRQKARSIAEEIPNAKIIDKFIAKLGNVDAVILDKGSVTDEWRTALCKGMVLSPVILIADSFADADIDPHDVAVRLVAPDDVEKKLPGALEWAKNTAQCFDELDQLTTKFQDTVEGVMMLDEEEDMSKSPNGRPTMQMLRNARRDSTNIFKKAAFGTLMLVLSLVVVGCCSASPQAEAAADVVYEGTVDYTAYTRPMIKDKIDALNALLEEENAKETPDPERVSALELEILEAEKQYDLGDALPYGVSGLRDYVYGKVSEEESTEPADPEPDNGN